jgi:hypothetical protein
MARIQLILFFLPLPNMLAWFLLSSEHCLDHIFCMLVDAIMAIKMEYGVKKNWMGDPCFPTKYAWDGVKCSNASGNTSRIISL